MGFGRGARGRGIRVACRGKVCGFTLFVLEGREGVCVCVLTDG